MANKIQLSEGKLSIIQKAKNYLKENKTQVLGTAILAGSIALAGCAVPLEKKIVTPASFPPGRLVTLTGEVMEGFKDINLKKDLNMPLAVYNSVDEYGQNLIVNIHEDFRFGINRQTIERIKTALNSHDYAIRLYGRTTYDKISYEINGVKRDVINIDADTISLSDDDGVKLILATDYDPIFTVMDPRTIITPINPNPGLSFGFTPWMQSPFNFNEINYWFQWISDWGYGGPYFGGALCNAWEIAWQDNDSDGLPNILDPYPFWKDGQNGPPPDSYYNSHQLYAGLNLRNVVNILQGKKELVIPKEGVQLHKDFLNIFAKNRQADTYRAQLTAKRQELVKEYRTMPANARIRNTDSMPTLESIAKRAGINPRDMNRSYNNPNVRSSGLIYGRGYGLGRMSNAELGVRGESSNSSSQEGYAIPSAGSSSSSASFSANTKTAADPQTNSGGGTTIKK